MLSEKKLGLVSIAAIMCIVAFFITSALYIDTSLNPQNSSFPSKENQTKINNVLIESTETKSQKNNSALSEKSIEELNRHIYLNEESKKILFEIRQTLIKNNIPATVIKQELQRAIKESVDGKLSFEQVAETFPKEVRGQFIQMMKTIVTHIEKNSKNKPLPPTLPPEPHVDPVEISNQHHLGENDLYIIDTGKIIRSGSAAENQWTEFSSE